MAVMNQFNRLLGEKEASENRRITVPEIAKATGLSRQTIYSWMNQTVTRYDERSLNSLCRFFKCGVGDLLVYEPDKMESELA